LIEIIDLKKTFPLTNILTYIKKILLDWVKRLGAIN
jgi:hypothetical protein